MSLRVVFMGTPEFSVPSLEALLASGYEVVGVFTQPDKPKGRGGRVQQSPVKETALRHGLPVYQPVKIRLDGLEPLRALRPDVCVTAAFGQILSQDILDVPPMGTVNVHASLLPRHRGASPIQWAILQGDEMTGVTTMLSDKGIDTGDMLLRCECPILPDDTADTLSRRLSDMGAELLVETLRRLESGDCPRQKQDDAQSTYDPMLNKDMGRIDFSRGTRDCLLRVRAMSPWPCAWVALKEGALKLWRVAPAEGCGAPGTVLRANRRDGLVVATADGAVEILELQAPGGKRMDARAFLLGHPIDAGVSLDEVKL